MIPAPLAKTASQCRSGKSINRKIYIERDTLFLVQAGWVLCCAVETFMAPAGLIRLLTATIIVVVQRQSLGSPSLSFSLSVCLSDYQASNAGPGRLKTEPDTITTQRRRFDLMVVDGLAGSATGPWPEPRHPNTTHFSICLDIYPCSGYDRSSMA